MLAQPSTPTGARGANASNISSSSPPADLTAQKLSRWSPSAAFLGLPGERNREQRGKRTSAQRSRARPTRGCHGGKGQRPQARAAKGLPVAGRRADPGPALPQPEEQRGLRYT